MMQPPHCHNWRECTRLVWEKLYRAAVRQFASKDVAPNDPAEAKANAELIVHACNSHDELLAACEALLHAIKLEDEDLVLVAGTLASAAIAKTTEETK